VGRLRIPAPISTVLTWVFVESKRGLPTAIVSLDLRLGGITVSLKGQRSNPVVVDRGCDRRRGAASLKILPDPVKITVALMTLMISAVILIVALGSAF